MPRDCVHSSRINLFKNRIDNYFVRAGYTSSHMLNLDKPTASLSAAIRAAAWMAILLNADITNRVRVDGAYFSPI